MRPTRANTKKLCATTITTLRVLSFLVYNQGLILQMEPFAQSFLMYHDYI